MQEPSAGAQIKSARDAKQWRVVTLSRAVDIAPYRICQLECEDRYPSADEWAKMQTVLDLGAYPQRKLVALPSVHRRWFPELPELELSSWSFDARFSAARDTFGCSADQAMMSLRQRPDFQLCMRFLNESNSDSGHEAYALTKLLAAGAKPGQHSPIRAGFRKFPIIDFGSRETRGDLRVPCLQFGLASGECLLFPQVTVQTRYRIHRLDALVCIYTPRNRIWFDLEVDGQGHDPRFDLRRQRALGLPTVRLRTEDLTAPDILATLEGKIAPLLGLPKAS